MIVNNSHRAKKVQSWRQIRVNMHSGKIVDAVIKAIIDGPTNGAKYQVDFGKDQTALISEWQIVKDRR